MTIPAVAARGAAIIEEAFLAYVGEFQRFTLQARLRFEARDWAGAMKDSADRLDVHPGLVAHAIDHLRDLLHGEPRDREAWREMKAIYARWIDGRPDGELAETFFNSIARRIFTTVGVDEEIELAAAGPFPAGPDGPAEDVADEYPCVPDLESAVARVLRRHEFSVGYADLPGDAAWIARAVSERCGSAPAERLQIVRAVFYRNKGAYLVGRVRTRAGDHPLAIALLNPAGRVVVDAALLTEDEVSVVFSFTRSYFFVDTPRPAALVAFLHGLMPRKPPSELYNSLGHNKHGKTMFYREWVRHVDGTGEEFDFAPGARGMVMIVFTMPGSDYVFKVIRDRFAPPKTSTREDVMANYRLVFTRDRAGRLADAHEFEHLRFERRRFAPALLEELREEAALTVEVDGDGVVLHHLYTERKMVPLDLYLREASPDEARGAILDYGEALRDLAATNIFPGDLLLKNFGVTRHGRLVFYDYDELCLLSDCRFRALPAPRDETEELADAPWYPVGPNDVFPEEFLPFLGLPDDLRAAFLEAHAEVLRPEFWWRMQQRHRDGVVSDLLPYPSSRRLRAGS